MVSKASHKRNIKVNVKTNTGRTSTTINYVLCNYYFSFALERDKTINFKSADQYRKWLEQQVQEWVNEQGIKSIVDSSYYEELLVRSIFNEGVERAQTLYKSDNLQLNL